jgi:hypothetical protein
VSFRVLVDAGRGASFASKLSTATSSGTLAAAIKKHGLAVAVSLTNAPSVLESSDKQQQPQQTPQPQPTAPSEISESDTMIAIAVGASIASLLVVITVLAISHWWFKRRVARRAMRKVSVLEGVDNVDVQSRPQISHGTRVSKMQVNNEAGTNVQYAASDPHPMEVNVEANQGGVRIEANLNDATAESGKNHLSADLDPAASESARKKTSVMRDFGNVMTRQELCFCF